MPHDPALVRSLRLIGESHDSITNLGSAEHVAVQESTLAALLDGQYDGELTIDELLAHGDHGLGTLNGLDGELVIVDGEAWRAGADGSVTRVSGSSLTPFAVVTRFGEADGSIVSEGLLNDDLLKRIDALLPGQSGNAVIRIDGDFDRIHARSVPRQTPPYRALAEVANDMVEWTWHDLKATVVGFRFETAAAGVEVVGHHLHVLSADRKRAGHVLGCDLRSGSIKVELINELHVELPSGLELPDPKRFDGDEVVRIIESE